MNRRTALLLGRVRMRRIDGRAVGRRSDGGLGVLLIGVRIALRAGTGTSPSVLLLVIKLLKVVAGLVVPPAHANVTTDANAASLLSDDTAQNGALGEPRELLGAEDGEWFRLDLEAPIDKGGGCVRTGNLHAVLGRARVVGVRLGVGVLELLVQVEAQAILALVPDREVREEEVASRHGAIEVGHARDEHACQDRKCRWVLRHATVRDGASGLQRRKEEEVGIVGEGDVVHGLALEDAKLDNRGWIDRAPVGRRCKSQSDDAARAEEGLTLGTRSTSPSTLGLLDDSQLIGDLSSILGRPRDLAGSLVADGHDGRRHGVGFGMGEI